MAATAADHHVLSAFPFLLARIRYTTLQEGVAVSLSHKGPSGVAPDIVWHTVTQRPTSRDDILFQWDRSENDTTNDTITFTFDTQPGGAITGAEVEVYMLWLAQASGGTS